MPVRYRDTSSRFSPSDKDLVPQKSGSYRMSGNAQRTPAPVRVVASVIPLRRKISIAEVALSVSGRQYLAANPGSRRSSMVISVSFIEVFAAAIAAIMPDAPPPIMPICLITDFKSSLQPFGKRQNCNYHTTSRFETQGIFPALLWKRRASRSKSAV